MAKQLATILSGINLTSPGNQLQNKIDQKNPLNKIPKLPY